MTKDTPTDLCILPHTQPKQHPVKLIIVICIKCFSIALLGNPLTSFIFDTKDQSVFFTGLALFFFPLRQFFLRDTFWVLESDPFNTWQTVTVLMTTQHFVFVLEPHPTVPRGLLPTQCLEAVPSGAWGDCMVGVRSQTPELPHTKHLLWPFKLSS